MVKSTKGIIRVYGCGGAGINIASKFMDDGGIKHQADLKISFIDTSLSNLTDKFRDEDIFHFENVDGSGKIRRENVTEIKRNVNKVLTTFEPEDINILIFSASGGSGSVIGPLILSELLDKDATTICMVVGSEESAISLNNTVNTLKTLDSISNIKEKPVIMYYEHLGNRLEADKSIESAISAIRLLCSKENQELDTMDIKNWINYHKVTTVEPQLSLLDITTGVADSCDSIDYLSVASLLTDREGDYVDVIPEYHVSGYLPEGYDSKDPDNYHFVISPKYINGILNHLVSRQEVIKKNLESRGNFKRVLSSSDEVSSEGLVL